MGATLTLTHLHESALCQESGDAFLDSRNGPAFCRFVPWTLLGGALHGRPPAWLVKQATQDEQRPGASSALRGASNRAYGAVPSRGSASVCQLAKGPVCGYK